MKACSMCEVANLQARRWSCGVKGRAPRIAGSYHQPCGGKRAQRSLRRKD
ncbi:uncharacterized protein PHALS_08558 [Plasmopara halstedii]|uniref:Uncharacterized protein n=1 Tax=Plasmopara halstedii TaxID=4781 RepID=A0A0P1ADQ6_PLAHL|nr:uncharacterized protein PHALS_08558 [Plasmopara halstedii]CEG38486.1 hypothetical protein PHALS_08558 [Plasmopara halstedii]|eukprot:XP_024574855.1 hypothetical protein PHALS_08558 [Plasmopara halstedii]